MEISQSSLRKMGEISVRHIFIKCPVIKEKMGKRSGLARIGKPLDDRRRQILSDIRNNRVVSDEVKLKISEGNKHYWKDKKRVPWNKGKKLHYEVWNKGNLKRTPMTVLDDDDPIYANFKKYRNRVSSRTRKTYKDNKSEINPLDLPIGRCGVVGAYQVDHIISVREGFESKIPVEIISGKDNLQILAWLDNIRKYDGTRKKP